jgi:hypothetical protein
MALAAQARHPERDFTDAVRKIATWLILLQFLHALVSKTATAACLATLPENCQNGSLYRVALYAIVPTGLATPTRSNPVSRSFSSHPGVDY